MRSPLRPEQAVFRAGWTTDIAYFFVNHVGIQLLTFLSLWPAMTLAQTLGMDEVSRLVRSQPIWLQVLELMLAADLVQYWVHRALHRVPALWRFHAIHHSIREMDWLAGSRLHLVDVVVTRGARRPARFCTRICGTCTLHLARHHCPARRAEPREHALQAASGSSDCS